MAEWWTKCQVRRPDKRDGWYQIAPALAQELLDGGAKNRPLKDARAQGIAGEILSGRFKPNGESIVFDENGRVNDGQHRLRACVLANRPITVYCVFGVPSQYFATFDQGKVRDGADNAALMGFTHYSLVAAIARLAIEYTEGTSASASRGKLSQERLRLYMQRNRERLNEAAELVHRNKKGLIRLIPTSHAAFVYHMNSGTYNGKATEFIEKLSSGAGLRSGDPLLVFRRRMLDMVGDKHHLRQHEKLALLIKTWNAYIEGRPVSLLRWSSSAETFPKFKDDIAAS